MPNVVDGVNQVVAVDFTGCLNELQLLMNELLPLFNNMNATLSITGDDANLIQQVVADFDSQWKEVEEEYGYAQSTN